MRFVGCIIIVIVSSFSVAQDCTAYVFLDAFDQKTTRGIDNLTAQDLEARMGNQLLPIVSVTQKLNNRVLVLAEAGQGDNSNSLLELQELVNHASMDQPIAFGIFAERTLFTEAFYKNPAQRNAEMKELIAQASSLGTRTSVFDALHDALARFGEHQPGDTILLVSRAADFHSHRNGADLEKEFFEHGTRLLFIYKSFSLRNGGGTVNDFHNLRELKQLVSKTGGMYTNFRDKGFLNFAVTGYLLEIKLPNALEKPREWQLKLRGGAARMHKDALMVYPWKFPPCHIQPREQSKTERERHSN